MNRFRFVVILGSKEQRSVMMGIKKIVMDVRQCVYSKRMLSDDVVMAYWSNGRNVTMEAKIRILRQTRAARSAVFRIAGMACSIPTKNVMMGIILMEMDVMSDVSRPIAETVYWN